MKLVTYSDGGQRVGAVVNGSLVDLSNSFDSVLTLIEGGESALEGARCIAVERDPVAEVSKVELRAPIPQRRRNVFCVGWNYLKHFEEGQGRRADQEIELPDTRPSSTSRRPP